MDSVYNVPTPEPQEKPRRFNIPTGSKELAFGFFALIFGMLFLNSLFFGGGFNIYSVQRNFAVFGYFY